ncbi:hypothetical protein B8W70_11580 [Pseudomonas sp. 1239]|nr:hypothetical protein B8W70_11580 [Pseudomonas sp. 1239]
MGCTGKSKMIPEGSTILTLTLSPGYIPADISVLTDKKSVLLPQLKIADILKYFLDGSLG